MKSARSFSPIFIFNFLFLIFNALPPPAPDRIRPKPAPEGVEGGVELCFAAFLLEESELAGSAGGELRGGDADEADGGRAAAVPGGEEVAGGAPEVGGEVGR